MVLESAEAGESSDLAVIDQYLQLPGKFLVEAGAGNLRLSQSLAERGASVLAIDPDPVQAARNRASAPIANVGFAQTGAESMPVETSGTDGVIFPYSLHHVPEELHEAVFDEVLRVLKPDGFLYIMEPVAEGLHNDIMKLFHDEEVVRRRAQDSIDKYALPVFATAKIVRYHNMVRYDSWEHFARRYAGKSYNTSYTEEQVRSSQVAKKFEELGNPSGYEFESPMKVTFLQNPRKSSSGT